MVGSSKILTVSYGTFSCTLEGFDDSFDAMKAIAEYFRDLAADDRYFGAEPPSPDAEMLARIAEREISRRVEAHGADGKIHLRADHAVLPAGPRGAVPATQPAPQRPAEDLPAQSLSTPPHDAKATPDNRQPRIPSQPVDGIADKLRRIRAVAAPSGGAGAGYTALRFDEDDAHAQDFLVGASHPDPGPDAMSDAPAPSAAVPDVQGTPLEDPAPWPGAPSVDGNGQQVDEDCAGAAPGADGPGNEYAGGVRFDIAEDACDTDAGAACFDGFGDFDEDILVLINADQSASQSVAGAQIHADEDLPNQPGSTGAGTSHSSGFDHAGTYEDEAGAADLRIYDALAQLVADTTSAGDADSAETGPVAEVAAIDALSGAAQPAPVPHADQARPLAARAFKMRRADVDAILDGGDFEQEADESPEPSGNAPESEENLQRALAAVEAELQDVPAPDAPVSDVAPSRPVDMGRERGADESGSPVKADSAQSTPTAYSPEGQSAQVDGATVPRSARIDTATPDAQAARIFDEADSQLGAPESNMRRSAIQHLRAAVAATRAEHHAGGDMQGDVDDRPYRDDLRNAVRPRRPGPVSGGLTARPGAATALRPATLKLVAEQRIDTPVQPVRPRRITRADLATEADSLSALETGTAGSDSGPGFARFAEQMGAVVLTDLLEAAAAYMADIEGKSQFSRPMLMQKLREAQKDEFSREDSLRSFGQLLRAGKLQKLRGGRFAVTSVTEFRQSA